jgi:hypothetical protein
VCAYVYVCVCALLFACVRACVDACVRRDDDRVIGRNSAHTNTPTCFEVLGDLGTDVGRVGVLA